MDWTHGRRDEGIQQIRYLKKVLLQVQWNAIIFKKTSIIFILRNKFD